MGTDLRSRVLHFIQTYDLIPKGSLAVVAVSGGADSLTLMHLLNQLKDELEIRLHVATLDHGLRGEAGAADAQFVEDTAQEWGVPCTRGSVDVNALANDWKMGIEAAARRARYAFLAQIAKEVGSRYVATAHNADDQAETVLMHLIRGAGLRGFAGMSPSDFLPNHADYMIVRPLLRIPRTEVDLYVQEVGLSPRSDATNLDVAYTRNRIRHELIPLLETYNPQIKRTLTQFSEIVKAEDEFIEHAFHKARIDVPVHWTEGRATLRLGAFLSLDIALQRRYVQMIVDLLQSGYGDDNAQIDFQHIELAIEMIAHGKTGQIALLGNGVRLRNEYGAAVFELESALVPYDVYPLMNEGERVNVTMPGVTTFGGRWQIEALQTAPFPSDDNKLSLRLVSPADAVFQLRVRRHGDQFSPLGMDGHHKSIKTWMVDAKVPKAFRDRVPLLIVNGHIAAILWGNVPIDEQFAVREAETKPIIWFVVKTNNSATS